MTYLKAMGWSDLAERSQNKHYICFHISDVGASWKVIFPKDAFRSLESPFKKKKVSWYSDKSLGALQSFPS